MLNARTKIGSSKQPTLLQGDNINMIRLPGQKGPNRISAMSTNDCVDSATSETRVAIGVDTVKTLVSTKAQSGLHF